MSSAFVNGLQAQKCLQYTYVDQNLGFFTDIFGFQKIYYGKVYIWADYTATENA